MVSQMRVDNQAKRSGLTLIETLVVTAIIGILVAMLIPAVQAVRASARKTTCQNNLRQTSLALHVYHAANTQLPSPYNGTSLSWPLEEQDLFHLHSWRAALLPHIEQSAIHDSIDWEALATDPENEKAATTAVSTYVCPSGQSPTANLGWGWRHGGLPSSDQPEGEKYRAVRSDYEALAGIWVIFEQPPPGTQDGDTRYLRWGVWGSATFDDGTITGNLTEYREGKFAEVADGLSNTIMLVERGGRPVHLVDGRPNVTADNPYADYPGQAGWSASSPFYWRTNFRDVGVNQDNALGAYSNHPGGAPIVLASGAITTLSETTDITTLAKLIGRADGEQ